MESRDDEEGALKHSGKVNFHCGWGIFKRQGLLWESGQMLHFATLFGISAPLGWIDFIRSVIHWYGKAVAFM